MTWLLLGILSMLAQPVQQREYHYESRYAYQVEAQYGEGNQDPTTASTAPTASSIAPSDQNAANDHATGHKDHAENKESHWYDAFAPPTWSNWVVACVGLAAAWTAVFTLIVIAWQAAETKHAAQAAADSVSAINRQTEHVSRQADYLERQIGIQQRSSRQWVHITKWQQCYRSESGMDVIEIGCEIRNPTTIPLRLDLIRAGTKGQHNDSAIASFLVPGTPFPFEFFARLDHKQMAEYKQGRLVIMAEISVFFTDAFDNQWNQIFQPTIACGGSGSLEVRETRTRMRRSGPNEPEEDWPN